MIINELREKVLKAVSRRADIKKGLDKLIVEEPNNEKFGDLSTNAAMVLANVLGKNPMEIAGELKEEVISEWGRVESISIAKPGFINFNLKDDFIKKSLKQITEEKEKFGFNNSGNGESVQLEYVSSNPTGKLHIGHGRWGALGDSLANIYKANGCRVYREYYINDYGTQVEKFSECAGCIYLKNFGVNTVYPADGYPEETVSMAVDRLIEKYGDRFLITGKGEKQLDKEPFKREIVEVMVSYISETLALMGVEFDSWFYESSLYKNSNFDRVIEDLKKKGAVYSRDGALWFRASSYVDDKDRVLIRKDGNPTYFASDIMYLINKVERGYDRTIYILGADHHGYIGRLTAIASALGIKEDMMVILIGQLVKIVDKGRAVKMSRRRGRLYSLRDLIQEVGKDAVRYFFTMSSLDTPMDFDISLAKQKSNQNPVFYVQYAHARIESIIKKLNEIKPENFDVKNFSIDRVDTSKLTFKNKSERKVAKILILYPDVVYMSCRNNAPHLITRYLHRLAAGFHYFYNHCRVVEDKGDKPVVDMDRFILIMLVRQVLKNALKLLNVNAPGKM
ncbi:MAG: arginine--tRNA ligase [Actinomycetota bacterium]|nr:arginine--tRNA ligase [Actinomycetota bacterium]